MARVRPFGCCGIWNCFETGAFMKETVLIIGSGPCARRLAERMTASGMDVLFAGFGTAESAAPLPSIRPHEAGGLETVDATVIRSLTGSAGRFTVAFTAPDRRILRPVQHILVAEETVTHDNSALYGLVKGPRVATLSTFTSTATTDVRGPEAETAPFRVVFLTGLFHESLPLTAREVMQAALDFQKGKKGQAYVFTGNLKVAGNGLEALCRKAKDAGVLFVKFTESGPEIKQEADGSVTLAFADEILRQPCVLQPDLIVVDEAFLPSPNLKTLGRILELEMGPDGFLQGDNIHRHLTFTNRKGIRVVGPARGVSSPPFTRAETDHTVLSVTSMKGAGSEPEEKARIESGKCIRCLTCIRICPHRAVELAPRPVITASACEGCGICVAECPCHAIAFPSFLSTTTPTPFEPGINGEPSGKISAVSPVLTIFCCARSAVPARNMAQAVGGGLPQNLSFIEVPCAGAVSQLHVLKAFENGADGVMVMGCHPDNCRSGRGTLLARTRSNTLKTLLSALGIEGERLAFESLAANMGAEFLRVLHNFRSTLKSLGPNRVEPGNRR